MEKGQQRRGKEANHHPIANIQVMKSSFYASQIARKAKADNSV